MTAPDVPAGGSATGEDYGYDLAHDVPRARPPKDDERKPRRPVAAPRREPGDGDLSYDEAHDRG
jgi:hypothetical protein